MAAKIQMLCVGILLLVRTGELSNSYTLVSLFFLVLVVSYGSYLVCIQLLGW